MSTNESEDKNWLYDVGLNIPLSISSFFSNTDTTSGINHTLPYIPRLPTPRIVPDMNQLHKDLLSKYRKYGRDKKNIINRPSVREIIKLLTLFHKSDEYLCLSNGNPWYYPCSSSATERSVECTSFLHCYKYNREVNCDKCKNGIKSNKRKKSRDVPSPSRN